MSGEQIKPGYKRTEVGVIPEDWSASVFRAVVETYIDFRGRTPRKLGMDWGGGDILALSANNVQMGAINTEKEAYFGSNDLYKKWMTQGDCEKGDILITMEAPLGNIAQIPDEKKYILSQRVLLIKPKSILTRDFLAHYMRGSYFQGQLVANSSGSTALGIQRARLDEITIATPPLSEQRAIATALSDVDALLAKLDQLIAKKRDLKQATMQQLLTGQTRLPGFSGEWEVKRLGDVAEVSKGEQLHSDETRTEGDFPHYNGGVSPSGFTRNKNAPANSIAISEGGNSCGFVQLIDQPFWCGGHCYLVVPKSIDKRFLYQALKWRQKSIMALRVGSGLPNVQKTALLAFSLESPIQREEQTEIATILSEMDAELTILEARLDKTRALKQGMMQELLTGRIRLV